MLIDIIYALILLLALIYGFKKGVIHSVVTLVALIIGIMAAVHFSQVAAVYIDKWFNVSSKYLPLISFVAVFVLIYLIFRLIEEALEGFFKLLKMNLLNQIAGALVWGLVWTLLYSTILFYLNNMQLIAADAKTDSIIFETVEPMAPETIATVGTLIPPAKNIFKDMQEWFSEQDRESGDENR